MGPAVPGANPTDCGRYGGPRWYVVCAEHRQERLAALSVQALRFPFFLPMVAAPLPNGASELRPLFGRYLFVELDLARDEWGRIASARGVGKPALLYMTDPTRPTPVPERMLDAVRRAMVKHSVVRDPVATLVSVGASVRIVGGAGSGREGQVVGARGRLREVRVECDGLVLTAWVPADRLQLLGGA